MKTRIVGLWAKPWLLPVGLLLFPPIGHGNELLTFDDLADGAGIPSGYGGLQWSNFAVISKQDPFCSDGYLAGMVSPPNVAYNPYGDNASLSSTNAFDLDSVYLTAAVLPSMSVEVVGYAGGNLVYDQVVMFTNAGPNFFTFNYLGVNQVNFIPIPNSQFVMDNLTVTLNSTNVSPPPPPPPPATNAPVPGEVDLGRLQVPSLGHQFAPWTNGLPPRQSGAQSVVLDYLVNQSQVPPGGATNLPVSANFDTNNQFVLTIAAPPGQRFLVHVPAGQSVSFEGQLEWQGSNVLDNGSGEFGTSAVSFNGLEGMAPGFGAQSAVLSQRHGCFGFNDIQSPFFTNDISFSSITLLATVPDTNARSGTLVYTPTSGNALAFYYTTSQTNDPGAFVSLVAATNGPEQELLTFDDVADGAGITNGYGGLAWNNFVVMGEQDPQSGGGYFAGVVSPPNVVYNPYGEEASLSSTNAFCFNSAYLTAAGSPSVSLAIEVQGWVGGNLAYDQTYVLTNTAPTFITFNYLGVNQVNFLPPSIGWFVMDNLTVTLNSTNVSVPAAPPTLVPAPVEGQVDLGQLQVPSLEHRFVPAQPWLPPWYPGAQSVVRDYLVDQRQVSPGGATNVPVSANFDTNDGFVLTLAAPPGERFQVHVPAGQSVRFAGLLDWSGTGGGAGIDGITTVSFDGLEGAPPPGYFAQSALLSQLHGYFGFNNIQSLAFTNDFSFTAITLSATVPDTYGDAGTRVYTPSGDNSLAFSYTTAQTNDPGPIVTLVPAAQPNALALGIAIPAMGKITRESNGDITVTFTGTLQSATMLTGPFVDVPGNPQGTYTIPKTSLGAQQYFRARQ